jgi:hypothetical protein
MTKTKRVTIDGTDYDLRKLSADVGGYIWQRVQSACLKASQEQDAAKLQEAEQAQALADALTKPAEERMRGVCVLAYMYMPFADYKFALNAAMKATSRYDQTGLPMPLMTDGGVWAAGTDDLQTDPSLATHVMTESLVFSLHPYLAVRSAPQTSLTA